MRSAAVGVLFGCAVAAFSSSTAATTDGRTIFSDPRKGNCHACHKVPNDPTIKAESTIGPALVNMRQRFPDRAKLRDLIADPTRLNPNTIMPPYGRHRILSPSELDAVVQFIESL